MRILTVCQEYPPVGGGGATACQVLAEALARKGHEIDVLASAMPDLPKVEVRGGVNIHRAACLRRRRHYSTAAELATWVPPALALGVGLLRRRHHDLIHCHFVVPGGLVAAPLARHFGLPLVLTAHGSDVPGYNPDRFGLMHRCIAPAWRRIVRAATTLTAPSAHLAGLIEAAAGRPVEVVPNPFDPPPVPSARARADIILVATRLVQRKGVQTLLEALNGAVPGFEIVVAGDGPLLEPLRAQARAHGLPVHFTGFVTRERLAELYAGARIFAFPSIQENFPMVLLEAMAHGCAVVTTSAPGCAEVVGDAALTVPPGDVAALRAAVRRLAHEPELTARLARRGARRVRRFASARIADAFLAIFAAARDGALTAPASRPLAPFR